MEAEAPPGWTSWRTDFSHWHSCSLPAPAAVAALHLAFPGWSLLTGPSAALCSPFGTSPGRLSAAARPPCCSHVIALCSGGERPSAQRQMPHPAIIIGAVSMRARRQMPPRKPPMGDRRLFRPKLLATSTSCSRLAAAMPLMPLCLQVRARGALHMAATQPQGMCLLLSRADVHLQLLRLHCRCTTHQDACSARLVSIHICVPTHSQ
jgi:hypothetical protein